MSADSKQYLFLDPGAFLGRAVHLWDAQAGAGGVSHQHLGYLWPMGPWFWFWDTVGALGVPGFLNFVGRHRFQFHDVARILRWVYAGRRRQAGITA